MAKIVYKATKLKCSRCQTKTSHAILSQIVIPVLHENSTDRYRNKYSVIQCRGCQKVSYIESRWLKLPSNTELSKVVNRYPPIEDYYVFLSADDRSELPSLINDLYYELITCLNGFAGTFSGMGMRMIVEATCKHKKIAGRDLKAKIQTLYDTRKLSEDDFKVIDRIREIGNKSAHEIKAPNDGLLAAGLEAINHLLRSVYIVPKRTKALNKKASTRRNTNP